MSKQATTAATAQSPPKTRHRAVTPKEAEQLARYAIDYRFVREVELLEREGYVESRATLEEDIGLSIGSLAQVRSGLRGVSTGNIFLLQQKYKADYRYILFGVRTMQHSVEESQALDSRPRFAPKIHQYAASARWNVGPRPEADPAHYYADPENKQWQPSTRRAKTKTDTQGEGA